MTEGTQPEGTAAKGTVAPVLGLREKRVEDLFQSFEARIPEGSDDDADVRPSAKRAVAGSKSLAGGLERRPCPRVALSSQLHPQSVVPMPFCQVPKASRIRLGLGEGCRRVHQHGILGQLLEDSGDAPSPLKVESCISVSPLENREAPIAEDFRLHQEAGSRAVPADDPPQALEVASVRSSQE